MYVNRNRTIRSLGEEKRRNDALFLPALLILYWRIIWWVLNVRLPVKKVVY